MCWTTGANDGDIMSEFTEGEAAASETSCPCLRPADFYLATCLRAASLQ